MTSTRKYYEIGLEYMQVLEPKELPDTASRLMYFKEVPGIIFYILQNEITKTSNLSFNDD